MSDIDELREAIRDARIYVIPYSHSDWAWTSSRQWHEERYVAVFADVLEIMRRDSSYKWYFDTENEQLAPLRNRRPELMEELKQRVWEGRVGIAGGTITNPHPHRVSGEMLIRNFCMGRRYFESEFPNVDLSVLTLNDVIYGHSQLPQIASKCGYRYYWGTRPQCLGERGVPRQFVWQSPDGSRLICARGQYMSSLTTRDYRGESWEEGATAFIETDVMPCLADSPTGAACAHATLWLFEADYDDMLRKLKATCEAARELVDDLVERLVRGDQTLEKRIHEDSFEELASKRAVVQDEGICVVNPESWPRQALVKLHKVCPRRGSRSLQIRDANDTAIAHQIVDPVLYEDGTLKEADVLIHARTPSLGYSLLSVSESQDGPEIQVPVLRELSTLACGGTELRFEEGRLISLVAGEVGREQFCCGEYAIGDLRYHAIEDTGPYHYGPVIDTLTFECTEAALIEDGDLRSLARLRGHIGDHQVEQQIAVYRTTPRVDFDVAIESVGGDGFFRVYFPFANDGKIVVDIPFGVERRDVTGEPYGSLERKRENVFYGANWADYSTPECGCALLVEPGMQGFCHFPERRLLGHTLLKTIVHPTTGWERFETRLREAKGLQRFRYALLPHRGDWAAGNADRESVEFRSPLRAYWQWPSDGKRARVEPESFLGCSAANVAVSSLYMEGPMVVLRLFETRGQRAENAEVRLPFNPASASKTDCLLRRVVDEAMTIEGDVLRCSLTPWEIATFAIEVAEEQRRLR